MDVRLDKVGDRKIGIIKVVRNVTLLTLKDAKDLVDRVLPYNPDRFADHSSSPVGTPTIVARNLSQSAATAMVRDIESYGGTATVIGDPFVIYVSLSRNTAGEIVADGVDVRKFQVWDDSRLVRVVLDSAVIENLFATDIPTLQGTITADEDGTRGIVSESPTAY